MFVRLPCGGVGVSTKQLQGEVVHYKSEVFVATVLREKGNLVNHS